MEATERRHFPLKESFLLLLRFWSDLPPTLSEDAAECRIRRLPAIDPVTRFLVDDGWRHFEVVAI